MSAHNVIGVYHYNDFFPVLNTNVFQYRPLQWPPLDISTKGGVWYHFLLSPIFLSGVSLREGGSLSSGGLLPEGSPCGQTNTCENIPSLAVGNYSRSPKYNFRPSDIWTTNNYSNSKKHLHRFVLRNLAKDISKCQSVQVFTFLACDHSEYICVKLLLIFLPD